MHPEGSLTIKPAPGIETLRGLMDSHFAAVVRVVHEDVVHPRRRPSREP
jgi:hypothetical protein